MEKVWREKLDLSLILTGSCLVAIGWYLGNWGITAGEIVVFVGLSIGWLQGHQVRGSASVPISIIFLTAFICINIASVFIFWGDYEAPWKELKKIRHWVLPVLVFFYCRNGRVNLGGGGILLIGKVVPMFWLLSATVATVSGLVGDFYGFNFLLWEPQKGNRSGGISGNVMTYAYSIQFTILFFCGLVWNQKWLAKALDIERSQLYFWASAIGAFVCGIGLYFSHTRGAFLGLGVGIIVWILMTHRKVIAFVLVIGVIILAGAAFLSGGRSMVNQAHSNRERISIWQGSALTFLESPIFGVGYRRFESVSVDVKKRFGLEKNRKRVNGKWTMVYQRGHSHNNFLEAFVSTGFVGGLLFIGFCVSWIRDVYDSDLGRRLFLPVVVAFVVSGFFENTFYDAEVVSLILILYIVSLLALEREAGEAVTLSNPEVNL